jgi:hypothetical protein
MAIFGFLLFLVPVGFCALGAFFVTNTVCQNRWKEKIPLEKLAGFAALFTVVFVTLCIFMMFASSIVFGR